MTSIRKSVPTWRMAPVELARVFADHFGWAGRSGGWIYDQNGRPVAHGWASLASRLAALGWIQRGVGVNWRLAGETPRLSRHGR